MFLTQEEYSGSESDEEETTTSEVATIATTSTPPTSLFESPNEDSPINNVKCLMAKDSEVSPTPSSISKTNDTSLNDLASLRLKEEIMAFDEYVSSVQGVHKLHFESLMSQYGQTLEKLDEQRRLEKEYVHEIASLKDSPE
jgi:hypothetical protein